MHTAIKFFLICLLCLVGAVIIYVLSVLTYTTLTEFKPPEKTATEIRGNAPMVIDASRNLRLLTWNIGYAGLGKEMDFFYEGGQQVRPSQELNSSYLSGITSFIELHSSLDVIILQEVDLDSKRSYGQNEMEIISNTIPDHTLSYAVNYRSAFVPVPILHPMGRVKSGLVTFSKFQPRQAYRLATPGNYPWPKRLYLLKRCFLVSRYKVTNGHELVIINLHNSAFDDASEQRAMETEMLYSLAMSEYDRGNYVIAGGDWNQNPPGWKASEIKDYKARQVWPLDRDLFPQDWTWAYDPRVPTNRDVSRPFRKDSTATTILDFFLLSPNLEKINAETLDLAFEYSDHQPVILQVGFR